MALADDALERLYAAPLEEFMRVRKELVAELKAAGEAAAARRVAEAKKPPRTTWALNQAVRREPDRARAFVEARARAAEAQRGAGDADELRAALDAYRKSVA